MAKEIIEAEIKSNIGEVADGIDKAAKNTEKLDEATKKGAKGFKSIGSAVKGVGVALKAAGIGIVVALLAKLMEVFKSNQKVVDFFNVAMESLSIAFNDLFGFLEKNVGKVTGWFKDIFENPQQSLRDFGTAIKENLIERFDSLLETFGHLGKALGHLFKGEFAEAWGSVKDAGKEMVDVYTGVDNSVDRITNTIVNAAGAIKDYAKETYKSAKATNELRRAAELAAVVNQGIIEQKDREAELQRQIRDDETKTFAERIAANEQLKVVLEEQEKLMLANAKTAVAYAQTQVAMNDNDANKIALQEALNEQDAIKAQIAGFMSEQLTNQVSLEKELGETKRELLLSGLEGMALELAELQTAYDLKIEMARKAGEDTTAITEKYEKDQAEIKKKYEKEKQKWTEMSAEAQLDIMSQTAGNMVKILGEETAAGKAMAVTQATIDTYKGATAAYSSMAGIPVVGPVLGAIAAGAAVASGLANVKAILSADASGGGGGGAPSTGGASAQAPAPEMLSGKFELGGGVEPEPLKAFVVTDEMTNSQDQLSNIRRRATV